MFKKGENFLLFHVAGLAVPYEVLLVCMYPPPNSFFSFSLSYLACIAAFAPSQVGFGERVVQDRLGTWTELSTVGSWNCHRKYELSTQSKTKQICDFFCFFFLYRWALTSKVVFERYPPHNDENPERILELYGLARETLFWLSLSLLSSSSVLWLYLNASLPPPPLSRKEGGGE